jgi:hypothetical protein
MTSSDVLCLGDEVVSALCVLFDDLPLTVSRLMMLPLGFQAALSVA